MICKILKIFSFCLPVFFFSACKKEYPEPQSDPPVFTFNGTINGSPVSIGAGENNYYMFTSYALGGNGVYEFQGELKDKDCSSNCANSLKITVRDYREYSVLATSIDSSLTAGYYSLASPSGTTSKFNIKFSGTFFPSGSAQDYTWNFGDGTTGFTTNDSITHQYSHPGVYNVSLVTQSTSACTSAIINDIQIGQTGNAFQATFSPLVTGTSMTFTCIPTTPSVAPYTYHWDFGDGGQSTLANPTHIYASNGVYLVTLTVTDATGYIDIQRQNVRTQPYTGCAAGFLINDNYVFNPNNLANVIVEWRDSNGALWTSMNNNQPAKTSQFRILSVENYMNNSSGQPTKKIHASISCVLYNGTNSISLENGDVTFAVAYF